MHRNQPAQCFEVEVLVAHDQVIAFDQREPQVTRQIGVFKIGFVVRPGCEQRNVGILPRRTHGLHALHQRPVSASQALHLQALERLRKQS